jgi:hypothetical protein
MGRIFGPKRGEMAGEWRQMHKEELQNIKYSPNMIRMIKEDEMGGVYSMKERKLKLIHSCSWKYHISLTMKMTTAMFVETVQNLQHSTRRISEVIH